MKTLKLSLALIYNKCFLHLLLIIQILIALIIGTSVMAEFASIYHQKNIIKDLGESNFVFFQGINSRDISTALTDGTGSITMFDSLDINTVRSSLKGDNTLAYQKNITFNSYKTGELFSISCFEEAVLENINLSVIKGKDFKETEKQPNTVRFITDCSAYKVGDTIPVKYTDNDGKTVDVTLLVIGIGEAPFFGPTTTRSATVTDQSTLTEEYSKSLSGYSIFGICCWEDLESIGGITAPSTSTPNYWVFFDTALSQNDIDGNIKELSKYGSVTEFESIMEETDKIIEENLRYVLPDILFICIISVAGFCGITLINISSNMRYLSVYYMLGCSDKKMNKILFMYVFVIEFAAFIPATLLFLLASVSQTLRDLIGYLSTDGLLVYLAVFSVFLILSFAFVKAAFKGQSIRQNYIN